MHNKTPVHSTSELLRVCAACSTPRLNLSYELRPSWNNIQDTFLIGSTPDTIAVILVKFLKGVQQSILISARMLKLLFSLFRKSTVHLFLLCPVITTPAVVAAERRAFEEFFRHITECAFQSRANTRHDARRRRPRMRCYMHYARNGAPSVPLTLRFSTKRTCLSPPPITPLQHGHVTAASSYKTSSQCGCVTGPHSR